MIYSHSRLSTFENCPQAFKFRYIDNIKTDEEGVEAFMGKRVHEALEYLYEKVKMGVIPELGDVMQHYVEGWDKHLHNKIKIVKNEYSIEDYKKLGEKCLIQYYSEYHPFEEKVLENEKLVNVEFDGIKLRGFVDRIDHYGDRIEIHDYKTGMSLPTQSKLDKDRQLALYQIGLQELFPDVKDFKLIWHYLAFGQKLVSRRTEDDLQQLKQDIKKTVNKIESEKEYLPKTSRLCDWCEYRVMCPAFSHERIEVNKTTKELVSEYVLLKEEQTQINQKIADLREKIVQIAADSGIKILKDDSHQLTLSEYQRLTMPKDDKLVTELYSAVKSAGILEEVSQINLTDLQNLLNELPPEVQKTIRPFLHEEVSKKLTVSRL